MSTIQLLLAEIRYRFFSFAMSLMAVAIAASLLTGGPTLIGWFANETETRLAVQEEASKTELDTFREETDTMLADMEKQTRRLMRDIGFNLYIVHRDTSFGDLHADFSAVDMPEEYVHRLADAEELTKVVHIVATLLEKIQWQGRTTLLVGILPEVTQTHIGKKPSMGYTIEPGTVLVGNDLADGRKVGDSIEIEGESFEIAQLLPSKGTWEDAMLALYLHDAQRVLNKPGVINRIIALGCKCEEESLPEIRAQLELVLPETKVTEYTAGAVARAEQRKLEAEKRSEMMHRLSESHGESLADLRLSREQSQKSFELLLGITTPIVVLICAALVGLLAWMNVLERRGEIGVLRAMGRTAPNIGSLILGKAILLGLAGGAVGSLAGFLLALGIAQAMDFTSGRMPIDGQIVLAILIGSPAVAAMASWLPTLIAVRQDPAHIMAEG